jgi:hypothetical protein
MLKSYQSLLFTIPFLAELILKEIRALDKYVEDPQNSISASYTVNRSWTRDFLDNTEGECIKAELFMSYNVDKDDINWLVRHQHWINHYERVPDHVLFQIFNYSTTYLLGNEPDFLYNFHMILHYMLWGLNPKFIEQNKRYIDDVHAEIQHHINYLSYYKPVLANNPTLSKEIHVQVEWLHKFITITKVIDDHNILLKLWTLFPPARVRENHLFLLLPYIVSIGVSTFMILNKKT